VSVTIRVRYSGKIYTMVHLVFGGEAGFLGVELSPFRAHTIALAANSLAEAASL